MSADYAPGTVAVATVRGVNGVRVVRVQSTAYTAPWVTPQPGLWRGVWHNDTDVTDVRPLVVLDLDDAPWVGPGSIPDLLRDLNERDHLRNIAPQRTAATRWLADQIEAQTTPRIPEPGLWGVVREASGRELIRYSLVAKRAWADVNNGNHLGWDEVDDDPTLIRDGVTP